MTRHLGLPKQAPMDGLPCSVRIWEVGPRDGLQNESTIIPTGVKVEFIDRLSSAGLPIIEATSFVRADRIPQLADGPEVMAGIARRAGTTYAALVPNLRGLIAAQQSDIAHVAVFASATESFAQQNLGHSLASQLEMLVPVAQRAREDGLAVRGYISMCFGDPWEGQVDQQAVVDIAHALIAAGCAEISLGDTIGVATPGHVQHLIGQLVTSGIDVERMGVHFHDTYGQALVNTLAAMQFGVTTIDASAGGLGGCPYARTATGNLATEDLVWMLEGLGIDTGVDLSELVRATTWLGTHIGRPPASRVARALSVP